MPDPSPSTLTVLNSNFLQLGRRSGGRPQRTVYPRRLPVNCDTHYVSRHRTHNLPIVSPMRYQYRDHNHMGKGRKSWSCHTDAGQDQPAWQLDKMPFNYIYATALIDRGTRDRTGRLRLTERRSDACLEAGCGSAQIDVGR